MSDIICELRFYAAKQKWPKGLEPLAILLSGAADLLSEAEKREKEARAKALEEASSEMMRHAKREMPIRVWRWDPYSRGGLVRIKRMNAAIRAKTFIRAAAAIRTLQSEER